VPAGGVAVLFNSDITVQNMIDAWDPGGASGALFIPVDALPALNNDGDTIAVWDSFAAYAADAAVADPPRLTDLAIAAVSFADAAPWPGSTSGQSIHLLHLGADPAIPASWARSSEGDLVASAKAAAVYAEAPIHPGGDIGSPGTFGNSGPTFAAADFDQSGAVNAADLVRWKGAFARTAGGDADSDGDSDGADFLRWQRQLTPASTAAIPEPTTSYGGALALAMALGVRPLRRRGKLSQRTSATVGSG
jgi:hypothetical protein